MGKDFSRNLHSRFLKIICSHSNNVNRVSLSLRRSSTTCATEWQWNVGEGDESFEENQSSAFSSRTDVLLTLNPNDNGRHDLLNDHSTTGEIPGNIFFFICVPSIDSSLFFEKKSVVRTKFSLSLSLTQFLV